MMATSIAISILRPAVVRDRWHERATTGIPLCEAAHKITRNWQPLRNWKPRD